MHKFLQYKIKFDVNKDLPNLSKFIIGPLESGFGVTIANSLRRILLSSIPSVAIFAIKIPKITHEFSSIPGIIEDVTHIIINLKKLAIKVDENIFNMDELNDKEIEKWTTLRIHSEQPQIIKAGDIICPPGFTIANPDLVICEKTNSEPFTMYLYPIKGRGYKSFHENIEMINSLNIIGIDSLFSPILNVEWKVEQEKISKQGTLDFLHMKIATNGSISANDAISFAAKILQSYLEPIVNINQEIANYEIIKPIDETPTKVVLSTSIDDLELTMRSFNCLKRHGIHTIQQLIDMTKLEVEQIRNLGKKSLKEILRKLVERNLELKPE